jgi:tRNA(fMet)-specific endonuclease VapC
MVYILDTDHISLMQNGHAACLNRLNMIGEEQVAITAITVEERVQGWLSAIRQASAPKKADRLVWGYVGLRQAVQYVNQFAILDWTDAAGQKFAELRSQGVKIGTQDLRIASIALLAGAVLVTRNQQDFSQVPGLQIEDWSI